MRLFSKGPDVSPSRWKIREVVLQGLVAAALAATSVVSASSCVSDGKGQVGDMHAQDFFPKCGNHVVDPGETCDDGNRLFGDGCGANCQYECSPNDGNANPGCSDGNSCNGEEVCSSNHTCKPALSALADGTKCGDFSVCQSGACQQRSLKCGDGAVQPPEECDSGKTAGDNFCDATCHWRCIQNDPNRACPVPACTLPTTCNPDHSCVPNLPGPDYAMCNSTSICLNGVCSPCGDGKVDPGFGEECDLGSGNGPNTGCEKNCRFSCKSTDSTRDCSAANKNECFVVNSSVCDDTTHICSPPNFQDNGTLCNNNTYNCVAGNCVPPLCGDGVPGPGEQCDDGNLDPRDGCKPDCTYTCRAGVGSDCSKSTSTQPALLTQPFCNADACTSGHTCTYGKANIGQPCSTSNGSGTCVAVSGTLVGACTVGTCGNGTRENGEECDLAGNNGAPGSGCEQTCQFSCHSDADCNDTDPCNGKETCQATSGGKVCVSDGNVLKDGDTCGTGRVCLLNLTGGCAKAFCGDGFVDQATENCDPPNTAGCSATCQRTIQCDLGDQWWAQMTEMPASWGQNTTWAAAFTGSIRQLMLVHAVQQPGVNPPTFNMALRVCGMQIPDFTLPDPVYKAIGHMEVYGIAFPNALWDNWTTDSQFAFSTTLTAYSLSPGGFIYIGPTALPTGGWSYGGVALSDWPSNYQDLLNTLWDPWEQVDMDQDSHPGITAVVKTGPIPVDSPVYAAQSSDPAYLSVVKAITDYSLTIADISGVDPTDASGSLATLGRANAFYVAIRALTNATAPYVAKLESCDLISGTMSVRSTDNHVLGCYLSQGTNSPGGCTTSDTQIMDALTPHYSVGNASFTARRIPNPPTSMTARDACTGARQQYATQFPP